MVLLKRQIINMIIDFDRFRGGRKRVKKGDDSRMLRLN